MNSLVDELARVVGADHVLTAAGEQAPYVTDWLGKYRGSALAVVRPGSSEEVRRVLAACHEAGAIVVPQGGHTSLSGGATPDGSGNAVVLSLTRMNRIREIDPIGNTITVDAGCVLARVQEAAREAGRFFPLSLGAEGSCTIGGNLAANAGGVAVLRYGTMRELTLGLEVVLPDGRMWDGLKALRKDNSGYSLRDLFIGSEGTLGVITGAVLKLFPEPRARAAAFVAVPGLDAALGLLAVVRERCGDRLTAFEFMTDVCLDLVTRHVADARLPFGSLPAAAVLVELSDTDGEAALAERLETALVDAVEAGLAEDAVVAQDGTQARAFWRLREGISEALVRAGKAAKHDVSVPVAEMAAFVREAGAAVEESAPGARPVVFGHLGDGNLHYNVLRPEVASEEAFAAAAPALTRRVHDVVARHQGSISAEHGIGQLRVGEMSGCKSPLELELMSALKTVLDPQWRFNPGKLLPPDMPARRPVE
ncbi:FAD/FMN-containing dehydrogenase [Chelatococcus caeni]|uniref:FAD/FMN-containing dehydrogenase n=1 Tax=Chelatococcus caeni TaxID=1348468 RepID=A0A840BQM6_9HYPH|nr:FAD-binding oxidoreductase [Chelatococcus caeni]MBB4015761.1 FAD/FMN-containing dehydrogenase [Chelatococcus caeni]